MSRQPCLPIQAVMAVVEIALRAGVSRSHFLAMAAFDPARLEEADGRIPTAEFSRLCELAIDIAANPALGLLCGELRVGARCNVVGSLVASSKTLRQGFQTLLQVQELVATPSRYELIEGEQTVTLHCANMQGVSERVRRFIAEVELTGFFQLIRGCADGAKPTQVCFDYVAPAHRDAYARVFGGVERFGQSFTGIVLDRALMDAPLLYRDERLYTVLLAHAEQSMARLSWRAGYVGRIQDFVIQHPAPGSLDMPAVAQALGMSVRSLRRRLAAEGTGYHAVVDQVMLTVAQRLLKVEQRSVQETAFVLGYSDSSAFHRAFKRWTGTTPCASRTTRSRQARH